MESVTLKDIGEIMVRSLIIFTVVFTGVGYMTLVERKVSGWIQDRIGPNRVGPAGLLQPLADGMKHLMKEDVLPPGAHRTLFVLAPMLALIPALLGMAIIPFADQPINLQQLGLPWNWEFAPYIADVEAGLLILLGLASLEVYGVVLAGWASGSKYSVMGGLRSSAQMISYELALGLAVLPVILTSSSLNLQEIVRQQAGSWSGIVPHWNVFIHPFGFLFLLIAIFAENKRLPFDLPEAEPELVAGYHTEYSAMKFVMFYMSEYTAMITNSALLVLLFFGGWQVPGVSLPQPWMTFLQAAVFLIKTFFFLFLFVWVRWTLPRFRYDQLMNLGWKVLLELAFVNLLVVAALTAAGWIRMDLAFIIFVTAGAAAVASALMVVIQKDAVLSALFLVVNLGCVAVLFLALGGEFLAAIQVIVYAGAIMVLFLFVIMLLSPARATRRFASGPATVGLTFALGVLFVAALWRGILGLPGAGDPLPAAPEGFGSAASLGELLFTDYLYPFEITGILLLVAMVGAVVLARREPMA